MESFTIETEVSAVGVKVPAWIAEDITVGTLQDIASSGCASGAYMPAMYYGQAAETMHEYGNDVLNYIEQVTGESTPELLAHIVKDGDSWSGIRCAILSYAVELWAVDALAQIGAEF